MSEQLECVFVADDPYEADIIIARLETEGIRASKSPLNAVAVSAFSKFGDIKIYVLGSAAAQRARDILAEDAAAPEVIESRMLPDVRLVCDQCRREVEFRNVASGSVQECPRCGAFLDMPD